VGSETGTLDFAQHVQPIFKKHCYECHGPNKQRNGYRLDRRSTAFTGRERDNIIPGSSESSRVYRRVLDSRFGTQMPPEDVLSLEETETLRRWIDAGAPWPDELANEVELPPPDPVALRIAKLLRSSVFDARSRREILATIRANPAVVNARGAGGTTPLMEAALYADSRLLAAMLDTGGDPNLRNYRGASALMWAVDDLAKTRLLLERGADPNASSDFGVTPLTLAAASTNSAAVVQALLDRGAEATQAALNAAARANPGALKLLSTRVPDKGEAAAMTALRMGCAQCFEILKSDPQSPMPRALVSFLPVASPGDPSLLRVALERNADVNAKDAKSRTPLMLAAISEIAPPDFVHELIRRGADVHATSSEGLNALDYAHRLGRAPIIEQLVKAGAKPTATDTPAPLMPVTGNDALAAIARSVPLLQRTGLTFYDKGGCVSCHHNLLGLMTTRALRDRNLDFDQAIAAKELRVLVEDLEHSRDQALQGIVVPGGAITTTGYLLLSLGASGHRADATTDALVRLVRRAQWPEGRWLSPIRPPSEASDFTATAVGMRGIQLYGNPRDPADRAAIAKAAAWLRRSVPNNTEDRTFQLLGLIWARAPARERRSAAEALLATQRPDGGWAQLAWRESDAYATGQVLVALREAGIATGSPAYQRGVRYLLDTQLADGSWLVRTRSHFTQTYFESGFPHGVHQFISAAATHWATQALIGSLPDAENARRPLQASVQ
jgi:ankyrin repeat protein